MQIKYIFEFPIRCKTEIFTRTYPTLSLQYQIPLQSLMYVIFCKHKVITICLKTFFFSLYYTNFITSKCLIGTSIKTFCYLQES